MKISELATKAGVGIETVRFYERKGLVKRPHRPRSGFRDYDDETKQRIRFIRGAQELGFSLDEIEDLLALRLDSRRSCSEVRAHAETKIADIDRKLATLRKMRSVLVDLTLHCPGEGPTSDCPILSAFD